MRFSPMPFAVPCSFGRAVRGGSRCAEYLRDPVLLHVSHIEHWVVVDPVIAVDEAKGCSGRDRQGGTGALGDHASLTDSR